MYIKFYLAYILRLFFSFLTFFFQSLYLALLVFSGRRGKRVAAVPQRVS